MSTDIKFPRDRLVQKQVQARIDRAPLEILREHRNGLRNASQTKDGISLTPNACKNISTDLLFVMDRFEVVLEAVKAIAAAHKFNVTSMAAHEVHSACFTALAAIYGEEELLADHQNFAVAKARPPLSPPSAIGDFPKREAPAIPRPHKPMSVVESGGMIWEIWSRNERSTTLGGRYYFACRCNPATQWLLIEHDAPIGQHPKELARRKTNTTETRKLSAEVQLFHAAQTVVHRSHNG